MKDSDVVAVLNRLIETCKDGEKGFMVCAQDLTDTQLKNSFTARAEECAAAALELQNLVRKLGGVAESTSSVSGMLHRRWVDIKSLITGKDTLSVLQECERGEDLAMRQYSTALEQNLPPDVRSVIEKQFRGVKKNHDHVKHLRDSVQAANNLQR